MALLKDEDREHLEKIFESMSEPVKLVMFTQEMECMYCKETRQIVEEVASLSDKITAEVYDFMGEAETRDRYKVDKIPAIAVVGEKDYGIRFFGIPSGYEFTTLIEDILMVSARTSGLGDETKQFLARLDGPLHMQVFVTPMCPYCPQAVHLAHQMAMESDNVNADMVEATEFPHLAVKYQVQGVPRTVINETFAVEGAAPEPMMLDRLKESVK